MKTVLVVDDNSIVRRHMRGLLERDGCVVLEAANGAEGLELASRQPVDVVFLDLHMPVLNGEGFLKAFVETHREIPVVLITSSESSHEIMRAVKLGARDYLLKPFREAQVRRAMQVVSGFDPSTMHRSRTELAILDSDEGFAQTVRGLVAETDVIEHVEQLSQVPECVARPHHLVIIGAFAGSGETDEDAEAIADIVLQHDPGAVLLRLMPNAKAVLPEVTVFHGSVPRGDDVRLSHAIHAVCSAGCLSSGRLVRARRYTGPVEFEALYWCALRVSLKATLMRMVTSGSSCTVDLGLVPPRPEAVADLSSWVTRLGEEHMVEFLVAHEPTPQTLVEAGGQTLITASRAEPPSMQLPIVVVEPAPSLVPPTPAGPFAVAGYEVTGIIGQGGMAQVFRAEQKSLRRSVCIKVLREELAQDPFLAQRFHDEGIALAALRHPNIVSVLDVGKTADGKLFLVMEYVEGCDVRQLLRAEGPLPIPRAVELMQQLLSGLAEAHGNAIVHRDLKPSNVLLTTLRDGSSLVKLVDFGIAKILEGARRTNATRVGTIVGTPGYMAPEQLLGMEVTPATDLYAAGVMLFELICGRRPFVARDEFELAQLTMMTPVPHLSQFVAGAPKELEALIEALLAKNPKDRPQSAAAVRAALAKVQLAAAA